MTTKRRWAVWTLAVTIIPAALALAQVSPEEAARLLEEMKQRDALARADRLERRLADAQKEIERLTAELEQSQTALTQARKSLEDSQVRVRELQDQLALVGMVRSASVSAASNEIPEVSARQLQIVGERFTGRAVKMSDCKFSTVHGNYTNIVPDVETLPDGRVQILRENHPDQWIGLIFADSAGQLFFHAYAPKDRFAELLLGMSRGTTMDLTGVIAPMLNPDADSADRFVLICDSIEPAP